LEGAYQEHEAAPERRDAIARVLLLPPCIVSRYIAIDVSSPSGHRILGGRRGGWPGRSSIARVERAHSDRARSASRRMTRPPSRSISLPCLVGIDREVRTSVELHHLMEYRSCEKSEAFYA